MAGLSKDHEQEIALAAQSDFVSGYNLESIELFSLTMKQDAPSSEQQGEGGSSFSGKIKMVAMPKSPLIIVFTTYTARKEPSKNFGSTVEATYISAVEHSADITANEPRRKIAEQISKYNSWQKFRDLLGFLVVQGNLSIPKPPNSLKSIEWEA